MRPLLIIGVGLFAMLGGIMDCEWFMSHRKAAFLAMLLGRNGTRIFYIILGAVLMSVGLLLATGMMM
jgi:hypothetical protein